MSRIYIPHINPLQIVEVDPIEIPQYNFKHMDDHWWIDRLSQWQNPDQYKAPWQSNDVVSLQFQNNMGQLQVQIVNCQNQAAATFLMDQKQQNKYLPDYFIYESNSALTGLSGTYFFIIRAGSSPVKKTFISEPINIQATQPDTILFEYVNRAFYQNLVFETGISPSLRVHGFLRLKDMPAKDTLYEDQVLDMVMVQSKPYRVWELYIGAPQQIPDYLIDKITRVLGCSDARIDGKFFTKNEGFKWEEADNLWNNALKAYKCELRESINRDSKIYDTEVDTNEELTLLVNSDSKGFADTSEDASSTIVTFVDVE